MGEGDAASLSIGAVAELTGVGVPTLRAWESRYGFPTPQRHGPERRGPEHHGRAHRRYSHADVDAITRVVEARRAGYSLEAAIGHVRSRDDAHDGHRSIYAAVNRRWPALPTRTINRITMLAISRAIEDECCARAARPLLIAAFQTPAAYAPARTRWRELARTASAAVVLAGFDRTTRRRDGPTEVAVDARSPVLREWAVICDAPRASACLVGWEHPDAEGRSGRRFEALWSVEPIVVRSAARAALRIAADHAPGLPPPDAAPLAAHEAEPIDPDRLVALTGRIVTHLDTALEQR